MWVFTVEAIANIIQIIVMLIVLTGCFRLFGRGTFSIAAFFFLFAIFANLIVDFYWLAYDLMKPEARMPFAANEFGEAAMFLLFASTIKTVFQGRLIRETGSLIISIFFIAASVSLWISWSGEWLQDIITGLSFGYLLCVTVMAMRTADIFSGKEWSASGICAVLLILLQTSTFFVPEPMKKPTDIVCYFFMFVILCLLLLKCIRFIRENETGERILAVSFACYVWCISTAYMSSGLWYVAALVAETIVCVPMFKGIQKEVQAE